MIYSNEYADWINSQRAATATEVITMDNTFNLEDYDLPRFRTVPLGYSKQDIIDFLSSFKYEILNSKKLAQENRRLQDEAARVDAEKESLAAQKLLIANTLIDAKLEAKRIREKAEAEAKEIKAKAMADAKVIKEQAELAIKSEDAKLKAIQDKIVTLKESVKNM